MLSDVLARVQAECPSFEVVAQAPTGATITTVDAATASTALKNLLETAVGNAYPVEFPEGKQPTDAAYRLVTARPSEVDGIRLATVVVFVVTLRAKTYADMMSALSAVESQVAAASEAISITDAALDVDSHRNHSIAEVELQYAIPAVAGGNDWPAVLIDADAYVGEPEGAELMPIRQRVRRRVRFNLISGTDNLATLRAELQAALLGWEVDGTHDPFHFTEGRPVTLPGGLYAWVDTYTDSIWITEPT